VCLDVLFGAGEGGNLDVVKPVQLSCYVLDGLAHDLILGMDFLARYNPVVDWRTACMHIASHGVSVCA